jgi:Flp pilus assembly protein TadG
MSRIERATRSRHRTIVEGPGLPGAIGLQGTRLRAGTRNRRQGQSLVEFAVVLPVFLLILAGILDFGLGLYSQMTIINASREGARLGVVEPGNVAGIQNRVEAMAAGLDQSQLNVIITCERPSGSSFVGCSSPQWQSGDAVVVRVDYDYRMLWPLALGNSLDLSSTVRMRIE